ncbi:MAG: ferrous iron transport protein A, partial [Rikenellaceae bacterium]
MRLSDLQTGESATIIKVMGHGGFRRRIMEMGFVKGHKVEVLLNAPLKDPIKYKIMSYEVSLRRSEAELIEVVSESHVLEHLQEVESPSTVNEEYMHETIVREHSHVI